MVKLKYNYRKDSDEWIGRKYLFIDMTWRLRDQSDEPLFCYFICRKWLLIASIDEMEFRFVIVTLTPNKTYIDLLLKKREFF